MEGADDSQCCVHLLREEEDLGEEAEDEGEGEVRRRASCLLLVAELPNDRVVR